MMAAQAELKERLNKQLYNAAKKGDIDAVKTLFAGNPTPDVNCTKTPIRRTALHAASENHDLALVQYLLSEGASPRIADSLGMTAAHTLCRSIVSDNGNNLAVLKLLLENNASVINQKHSVFGETCLHMASRRAQAHLVQWLLHAGSDATALDDGGRTAWDIAIDRSFHYAPQQHIGNPVQVYRIFVRKEMESGNIENVLDRIRRENTGTLEVYQLAGANVLDVYILLEYLMYRAPLRQACQQIRQELRRFIKTGNRWVYREPFCILEAYDHGHDDTWDAVLGGVCNESTYEDFKESVSRERGVARRKTRNFEVVAPILIHDSQKAGSEESLYGSSDKKSVRPVESTQETCGSPNAKAQPSDYLSIVMPSICVVRSSTLNLQRRVVQGEFRYRHNNQIDLQGFDSPLTLDEYCYSALSGDILTRRNTDQTLTRFDKLVLHSSKQFRHLVVIDQVWVWLSQDVLICTCRILGNSFREVLNANSSSSRYTQIGHYLAAMVDSPQSDFIFDTFQNYIVMLAENVSSYIDEEGVESMTIKSEKKFYHNINDVREELSMIRRVLSQQEEVWRQFASNAWPDLWAHSRNGRMEMPSDSQNNSNTEDHKAIMRLIMRPILRIQKSQRRISQLDEDAERVERSIANQLDLKQKHASLKEAHSLAVMSTAVFGFTIITIIFTPLSFVMSLFALPIDRFQNNQIPSRWTSDAGMYSTHYIGTWTATIEVTSIFVTILAMWLALELGLKYPVTSKVQGHLINLPHTTLALFTTLLAKIKSLKHKQLLSRKPKKDSIEAGV